jgi:hypothetical protein
VVEQNRFGTVIPSTDEPTAPGYPPPSAPAGHAAAYGTGSSARVIVRSAVEYRS